MKSRIDTPSPIDGDNKPKGLFSKFGGLAKKTKKFEDSNDKEKGK